MTITDVAKICHEANRVYCETLGDKSQKSWDEAEEWQRESAKKGVQFRLDNPDCGAIEQHNAWKEEKVRDGWVHGEVKDSVKKTHPCLVPYEQLPLTQRIKDDLFMSIVDCFTGLIEP